MDLNVSLEKVARYTVVSSGVLASQMVVSTILPEKRNGYKFWLKVGFSTIVTVVGVSMLMDHCHGHKVIKISSSRKQAKMVEANL